MAIFQDFSNGLISHWHTSLVELVFPSATTPRLVVAPFVKNRLARPAAGRLIAIGTHQLIIIAMWQRSVPWQCVLPHLLTNYIKSHQLMLADKTWISYLVATGPFRTHQVWYENTVIGFATRRGVPCWHHIDVIDAMASQITSLMIVYTTVYSGPDQRKHQSSASLAFMRGIHRRPVNSPHKGPVTRKMFQFDDVIVIAVHGEGV